MMLLRFQPCLMTRCSTSREQGPQMSARLGQSARFAFFV